MNEHVLLLKSSFNEQRIPVQGVSLEFIEDFEFGAGYKLPADLKSFFLNVNGTNGEYDSSFFKFYPFELFKPVDIFFSDWKGIPDYQLLSSKLPNANECFVFADYQMCLFSYAIRLKKTESSINEIYVLCGDEFKIVANSFSEFLSLYFEESVSLQL